MLSSVSLTILLVVLHLLGQQHNTFVIILIKYMELVVSAKTQHTGALLKSKLASISENIQSMWGVGFLIKNILP